LAYQFLIVFKVTQEDIETAKPNSPSDCPIAKAMKRATGKPTLVGLIDAAVYFGERKQVTKTYSKAIGTIYTHKYEQWVRDFDNGREVRPFIGRMRLDTNG